MDRHGQRSDRRPRRPRAQPQEHRPRDPARPARRHHRAVGLGQVVARLRHDLRRGPAPLRRDRCRPTPASSSSRWRSPTSTRSRGCRRRSRSSRRRRRRTRARPSAPSPRSTTTCACCSRASACPHCPQCGRVIAAQTVQQMVDRVLALPAGTRAAGAGAGRARAARASTRSSSSICARQGYSRVRVDGEVRELGEEIELDKKRKHTIEVVVDRLVVRDTLGSRLADSLETALRLADGVVAAGGDGASGGRRPDRVFSERWPAPTAASRFPEIAPRMFSFNSPYGACPECDGIGRAARSTPSGSCRTPRARSRTARSRRGPGRETTYFRQTLAGARQAAPVLARRRRGPSCKKPRARRDPATASSDGGFEGVVQDARAPLSRDASEDARGGDRARSWPSGPCPACRPRLRRSRSASRSRGRSIAEVGAA